ncbi:protein FAR1-RELATED SEQUENCE 5-like [Arachis ipaensis]|uniref:protein FAR1-RELATED SEQUENCE 5-like n=1 Tax=Arachis ipaensis TaxID=130454 RepID=UPI0007AF5FF1|nr:protein FAR1-RELATED SEQUENCE 5-like [Arachis ipaensis]XP_025635859.1 protein FAR1-RELATED SEQUENCE 5-like [Arachis hypogaea]
MESISSNDEVVPSIGMTFPSVKDYETFYTNYAKRVGFSWNIRTTKWNQNRQITYQILVCSKAGYQRSKIDPLKKTNLTSEQNCKVRIIVKKDKKLEYVLTFVNNQHNHVISPSMANTLRKNRELSLHAKWIAEINDQAGVTMRNRYQSLATTAGGYDKLTFNEKDLRNHVAKSDATTKPQLLYEVKLDEQHLIEHALWADARSRAAYEHFGDVVSFDMTDRDRDRYDMPFASFVGVNHHGQSLLLGCVILSCEEESSFVWLFDCWIRCMGGKPPIGILTDQCKAMQNAIEKSLPMTQYRWSKEAFESSWTDFINIFSLHNNWLAGLYEERDKWVLIFLSNSFWVGMSSTQRSESMHSFMKGYLTSKSNLQQFVTQHDNCLVNKAQKEYELDAASFNTIIPCATASAIEKLFQKEYSHAKFNELQKEFRAKANCFSTKEHEQGYIVTYKVIEEIENGDKMFDSMYEVLFDSSTSDVSCQCHLFESKGILCCHTLSVLGLVRVKKLPNKYILDRWKKTLKHKHIASSVAMIQAV